MQYTSKCKKCEKAFTHPTQERADQAMRMHMGRMHSRTLMRSGHMLGGRKKRPYQKKKQKPIQVAVNFCPACGCNLHSVAVGMAMASK